MQTFEFGRIDASKRLSRLRLGDVLIRFGLSEQLFPKIRMCNINERQTSFSNGLAIQIGSTMFGNDVFDIGSGY